ncbi:MAG: hypothetical protein ABI699_12145 [Caldimonas sp.]
MSRGALVALALAVAGWPVHARAQEFDLQRDCAQWVEKHGYSADYIKLKVGRRQRGMVETWRGNVEPKDVQPADVVLTTIRHKSSGMRASYVEEVRRTADGSAATVLVSEWNVGPFIDERCNVTEHFGRLSPPRPIPIEAVVRVWRPSLPLPAP